MTDRAKPVGYYSRAAGVCNSRRAVTARQTSASRHADRNPHSRDSLLVQKRACPASLGDAHADKRQVVRLLHQPGEAANVPLNAFEHRADFERTMVAE